MCPVFVRSRRELSTATPNVVPPPIAATLMADTRAITAASTPHPFYSMTYELTVNSGLLHWIADPDVNVYPPVILVANDRFTDPPL